jgi:hypothetical protein
METQLFKFESDILTMSKADLISASASAVNNFDESFNDPIKQLALISKFQIMLENMEKGIKEKSMTDLEKHGGKLSAFGIEFAIQEVGTKYDYSANQKWNDLQSQIEELKAKQKEAENFCKNLPSSIEVLDSESGELITWHKPVKTSTTSIKKTIK